MTGTVQLSFRLDGQAELDRRIEHLAARCGNLSPYFEKLAGELRAAIAQRFAHQGEPAWPQLSRAYAAWKAKRFPGKPMLQRTGALLAAVTNPDVQISAGQLAMTVQNAYASYHESRGPRSSGLPRRAAFELTE